MDNNKQWMPIATAPTKGESVLIANDAGDIVVAWFHGTNQGKDLWCYFMGDYACFVHNPTYWMPLPNVPEGE